MSDHTQNLESIYQNGATIEQFTRGYLRYFADMLSRLDVDVISQIIEALSAAAASGNVIYILGNGGSAGNASHMANDLMVGAWLPDHPPFRVVALTDNVPIITAVANDFGYEHVFTMQLRNLLQSGDVVIAFSVSGNSPNVVEAVRLANQREAVTIGCGGFDGGQLKEVASVFLHVPSHPGEYGPVEDAMMVLNHLIHAYFTLSRKGTLRRQSL